MFEPMTIEQIVFEPMTIELSMFEPVTTEQIVLEPMSIEQIVFEAMTIAFCVSQMILICAFLKLKILKYNLNFKGSSLMIRVLSSGGRYNHRLLGYTR